MSSRRRKIDVAGLIAAGFEIESGNVIEGDIPAFVSLEVPGEGLIGNPDNPNACRVPEKRADIRRWRASSAALRDGYSRRDHAGIHGALGSSQVSLSLSTSTLSNSISRVP